MTLEPRCRGLCADRRDSRMGCRSLRVPMPAIGAAAGLSEAEVLSRLEYLLNQDIIKRSASWCVTTSWLPRNAMVVWNIPDERIDELGRCIGASGLVNLCYQRPRRLPDWPYNLFAMIHGKDRAAVLERLDLMRDQCGLMDFDHEVLFSQNNASSRPARTISKRNARRRRDGRAGSGAHQYLQGGFPVANGRMPRWQHAWAATSKP